MKRPKFTREQEDWMCEALGYWYLTYKSKITNSRQPNNFGIATEELKMILCGEMKESM